TIDFSTIGSGVSLDLSYSGYQNTGAGGTVLVVAGTVQIVKGSAAGSTLSGGSGSGTLIGVAGSGTVTLKGGSGTTFFAPGSGSISIVVGSGTSWLDFAGSPAPVNVNLS